ncbi:DUF3037 domain-containing protein [Burkholderia multivorans]|uniref:DUF3037 domain-containing protein n=1 Tax=Burkholderia multivorans TaxID=87883 RepID=UPI0019BE1D00|nr:DUF3037 domain-containing protein [Burkholderia multivorans]MBU9240697.1 DUF3037 domain-containing protein [Burkholderia multivorans]MBU9675592.1 DUF3037 domain-containing protein [Burkholderia multivorans]MCL4651429.1 DUF3037 domain-containing protein [Burkholderia multivorans]MCL4655351.1 DUF3037 domain-containing protein [Burkholderia multivorans]MCO1425931.1 DUF3037 domain-containing protein [Burkholderia multivorans]
MTVIAHKEKIEFKTCPSPNGRNSYSYSILRYIHDISTGEFVNVGIAIYSANANYFEFNLRRSLGTISEIFPDIKAHAFKSLLRTVGRRLESVKSNFGSVLRLNDDPRSLDELLAQTLPKDDSALVWANQGTGVSANLDSVFLRLFDRYVAKYDRPKQRHGRTDEDVARSVKKKLAERNLLEFFEEKTIQGKSDDVKFDLAWKNGVWHCIEPLSFDLNAAENIRDKAHKCAGSIVGISDSPDKFKIYLVLAKPNRPELANAFERAMGILDNVSSAEIYAEDDQESLLDKLTQDISNHNQLRS